MKTISLIVNCIADTIIEAMGGITQVEEPIDPDIISEDKKKIELMDKSNLGASTELETSSDTKKEPEGELELVSEDEEVNKDVKEESQEK